MRFAGRGPDLSRAAARAATGAPGDTAWAHQVHSARVLTARAGACGEGDALVTHAHDLTLAIAVADCVPLAIAGAGAVALLHAGWKGIARGIVPAAVATLPVSAEGLTAWIGPAIGACCYEVGEDVAERVAGASDPSAVVSGRRHDRPHLDLSRAVERQLHALDIRRIEITRVCTRCRSDELWSHRAAGAGAGRNFAFAWKPGSPGPAAQASLLSS